MKRRQAILAFRYYVNFPFMTRCHFPPPPRTPCPCYHTFPSYPTLWLAFGLHYLLYQGGWMRYLPSSHTTIPTCLLLPYIAYHHHGYIACVFRPYTGLVLLVLYTSYHTFHRLLCARVLCGCFSYLYLQLVILLTSMHIFSILPFLRSPAAPAFYIQPLYYGAFPPYKYSNIYHTYLHLPA